MGMNVLFIYHYIVDGNFSVEVNVNAGRANNNVGDVLRWSCQLSSCCPNQAI